MSWITILTLLQILGSLGLAFRLVRMELVRNYPCFATFLIFEAVRVGAMSAIPRNTNVYALVYFFSQPILWVFYALITLEVFQAAFKTQPGIATLSRRLIAYCLTGSVLLSTASSALEVQRNASPYRILENYLSVERVVNCSLLLFVVLLLIALTWLPIVLTRNALIHACIFCFFFSVKTGLFLFRNALGPEVADIFNAVLLVSTLVTLSLWGFLLTKAGDTLRVRSGYRLDPVREHQLMAQLDAINRTLIGTVKK